MLLDEIGVAGKACVEYKALGPTDVRGEQQTKQPAVASSAVAAQHPRERRVHHVSGLVKRPFRRETWHGDGAVTSRGWRRQASDYARTEIDIGTHDHAPSMCGECAYPQIDGRVMPWCGGVGRA